MAISLTIGAFVYSMRAIFFAPMDEVDVPREIAGSAILSWFLLSVIFREHSCTRSMKDLDNKVYRNRGVSGIVYLPSWLHLQLAELLLVTYILGIIRNQKKTGCESCIIYF